MHHENQACCLRRRSPGRFGFGHRSGGFGVCPSGFRLRRLDRRRRHPHRHRCRDHGHHRDHSHASSRHAVRAFWSFARVGPGVYPWGHFFLDLLRCNTFLCIFVGPGRRTWEGVLRDSILVYINHRNDSIARASRDAAEFIILRHDILYSPLLAVVFGGICIVVSVYLIAKSVEARP